MAPLPKSLGVVDGVVIAASSTAATTSIAIGTGVLASIVGRQVPVLLILAFLPMIGIAGAYARLNRSEPNCGAGYTWVGRTLGPWLGFLAGWIPVVGTTIFLAYTTAICGSLLIQSAEKLGGVWKCIGEDDAIPNDEDVARPRLVDRDVYELRLRQWRNVDPISVDEKSAVRQRAARGLQVQTAPHRNGRDRIAEGRDRLAQSQYALGIGAWRLADVQSPPRDDDVAAVDGCRTLDSLDLSKLPQRGLDSSWFRASRLSTGRHHHGQLAEDDCGVLDEDAVGHRAIDVENNHLRTALLQSSAIGGVLPKRQLVVDVSLIDERPLATLHVRRGDMCQSDQRSHIGSCHTVRFVRGVKADRATALSKALARLARRRTGSRGKFGT